MSDNKYHMYVLSYDKNRVRVYVDGEHAYVRKPVRYKKLKRFWKLLCNRRLRQRLKRYQKARRRWRWKGNYSQAVYPGKFVNRALSSDEIHQIFVESGLAESDQP
jgi:hypothetical protein